jgi:hypothetical protein
VPDLLVSGLRIPLHDLFGGHDHSWRAKAALQGVFIPEGFLHGVQLSVCRQPFDGQDIAAVGLNGEHRAAFDRFTVHVHGARAANRGLAANVWTRQTGDFPKVMDEQHARFDSIGTLLSIDSEGDVFGHGGSTSGY